MAKKRKSDATRLDEVDRSMYSTFCSAANSLSQIYTQTMAQQKVSFQAGERCALEKLCQWILRQHEGGAIVTAAEVVAYLQLESWIFIYNCPGHALEWFEKKMHGNEEAEDAQLLLEHRALIQHENEIDCGGEDVSMSPRLQFPNHPQPATHFTNTNTQASSGVFGSATVVLAQRTGHADQTKNSIFSNALSSPVRRGLQPYHLAQGGGYYPNSVSLNGSGTRNHEVAFANQSRDSNPLSSNDSSMDMHSDSPSHESY